MPVETSMASGIAFVTIAAGATILTSVLLIIRAWRLRQLQAAPFPEAWAEVLQRNLPPYEALSINEQSKLHECINVMLGTKHFEGCAGLELTDEIRVTIAAHACMLLLNRHIAVYPRLRTILVYPSTYIAGKKGLFTEERAGAARLGESWSTGVVVLAWNSVKGGAVNFDDGRNVTLHEFAHQLDQADGNTDGAPALEDRSSYRTWAQVLSGEYKALQKRTRKGRKSVLNQYGATNPAEFFAVATETFFEKPVQMQRKHAELYEELKQYYKTDPLDWE